MQQHEIVITARSLGTKVQAMCLACEDWIGPLRDRVEEAERDGEAHRIVMAKVSQPTRGVEYFITVIKKDGEEITAVFSGTTVFDNLKSTFEDAWKAVHEDIGFRVFGHEIQSGDVIAAHNMAVTKIIDSQTTTSGKNFILAELGNETIVTFEADRTYEVHRMAK